jgi:hypothetical protein
MMREMKVTSRGATLTAFIALDCVEKMRVSIKISLLMNDKAKENED